MSAICLEPLLAYFVFHFFVECVRSKIELKNLYNYVLRYVCLNIVSSELQHPELLPRSC